jgi:hypothetical protein
MVLAMRSARSRGSAHEVAVTQLCEAEIRQAHGERGQAAALLDKAQAAFDGLAMTWHRSEADKLRRSFRM